MIISPELAQLIIGQLREFLDYNINIMNHKGIIMASSDPGRLNQVHQGAIEVLKSKRELIIDSTEVKNLKGTRRGVNLPIIIHTDYIGTVGITGDPKEVYPVARIVKVTVESLLMQKQMSDQLRYKQKAIDDWIMDLIKTKDEDNHELEEKAALIKLDVTKTFAISILQVDDLLNHTMSHQDRTVLTEKIMRLLDYDIECYFTAQIGRDKFVLGIPATRDTSVEALENRAQNLHRRLSRLDVTFYLGIGFISADISGYRRSYFDALHSVELLKKLGLFGRVKHIRRWGLLRLLDSIPDSKKCSYIEQYQYIERGISDFIPTLEAFFDEDLNMKSTSNRLYIHRNTLLYRLDKIRDKTGLNPRRFKDAMILKILFDMRKTIN